MSSDAIVARCLTFDDEQSRASALTGVAEYLDPEGLVLAWQTLPSFTDEHAQARVVYGVLRRLPAIFAEQAVELAMTMRQRSNRMGVLANAFALVAEQDRERVFDLILHAEAGQGDYFSSTTVYSLAPHLDSGQLDRIVELLRSTGPAECLANIAEHLSSPQLDIALDETARFHDDNLCALSLTRLAPWLDPAQIAAAAAIAQNLRDTPCRARAFGGLIAYLDGSARHHASGEISQAVITYPDSLIAQLGLHAGKQHMARDHLTPIIAAVGRDDHMNAHRLTQLAPFLDPAGLTHALSAAGRISLPWAQASALTGLIPHLSTEQGQIAIDELFAIDGLPEIIRVENLVRIASFLTTAQVDRVVGLIGSLQTVGTLPFGLERTAQYFTADQLEAVRATIARLTTGSEDEPQDRDDYEEDPDDYEEIEQLVQSIRSARS